MICRWGSLIAKKMILSGLLLVLIPIRHAVSSYQDDYSPRWPTGIKPKHHQPIHQYSQTAQPAIANPHHHRHHHEHIQKSNREMHIKPQHSHFYHGRDYRPGRPSTKITTTTTTTRTVPRTLSAPAWKWSSSIAANVRLAELTHIAHQGGNETSAGSTAFKNRLSGGERQQWSANNKQIFPMKMNTNASTSTSIIRSGSHHLDRSSWPHYSNPEQQHEERHLRVEDKHRTLLKNTSRMAVVDTVKISHDDQRFKSIADNKEDYDYYNNEDEESDEVLTENKIETGKGQQDVVDDFNFDYVEDEPNPQSDDQNPNSLKTESLTEEKWKNYGTAEAVEKSRRRYINEGQAAATTHIQRIKEEIKCRWPHPKVIPVTEASKRFVPHCTILHRCGDDTGCCDVDTKTCVAKTTATVHLHFFVSPLVGSARVEVRSFVNHTECHCVDRCHLGSCADSAGGVSSINYSGDVGSTTLSGNETCRCPSHFDVIQEELARGRCRCDCFNSNQACNTLKRGQDGFPADDQKCISDEECQMPTCQYGPYSTYSGRCPKSKHQKRTISRYDYR